MLCKRSWLFGLLIPLNRWEICFIIIYLACLTCFSTLSLKVNGEVFYNLLFCWCFLFELMANCDIKARPLDLVQMIMYFWRETGGRNLKLVHFHGTIKLCYLKRMQFNRFCFLDAALLLSFYLQSMC